MPEMDYGLVAAQNGSIGSAQNGAPPHAVFYIEVADAQAALDKATALGGQVIMPRTVIPDMVTFALFKDLDGNSIGLVEAA